MDKKISETIFEKIKKNNIKPKPRWEFLLRDYTIWTLFGVSLIVGSLAFSVILYMFANNDWNLYEYVTGNFLAFLFVTLPYFWLIILAIFVVLAYYNLRHTKRGYLLSLGKIFLFSLVSSFLLGSLLYFAGLGRSINNVFSEKIPFYEKFLERRSFVWHNPPKGLLAGKVTQKIDSRRFYLVDLKGDEWCVECYNDFGCSFIKGDRDEIIKIIGNLGEECFQAKIIKPFRPMPCFGGACFEHFSNMNPKHKMVCPNCPRY